MPVFQYIALDVRGREMRGVVEAADARAAAGVLRGQTLSVVQLNRPQSEARPGALSQSSGLRMEFGLAMLRSVRGHDLIFFFRQTAVMLRSGLTILQALEVGRQHASKLRLTRALEAMSEKIKTGKSFSQVLALHPRLFSTFMVRLVESAEASGELGPILDRIATSLEDKAQLRASLLTSLTYPAVVVVTSIGVVAYLVTGIIPKFAKFFAQKGATLPWSTQLLLDISGFATTYGVAIAAVLAAVFVALAAAYSTKAGRLALDRALLRLPVVGTLLTAGAMAQMSRTMATLLHSGVAMLDTLRIVSGVVANRAIAARLEAAAEQILQGRDLAGSLMHPTFPPLVLQMIGVGERTGALEHVLEEAAKFYERDLQARTRRMTILIEPLLILIIGGMVGFVYYSFFQAILSLATAGR